MSISDAIGVSSVTAPASAGWRVRRARPSHHSSQVSGCDPCHQHLVLGGRQGYMLDYAYYISHMVRHSHYVGYSVPYMVSPDNMFCSPDN